MHRVNSWPFLVGAKIVGGFTFEGVPHNIYLAPDMSNLKFLEANRDLNTAHVRQLTKSIETMNLINFLIVNEKGEVIDGQHRSQAYGNLKMSAMVIVATGYKVRQVQHYNTNQHNWGPTDFMNAFLQSPSPTA